MMRSLYSGVSGLKNHQTRMDVIGNNISNVNTTGFKSSRTTFVDMLSQTLTGASSPQDNVGGTNPKQIGLGSSVSSIDLLFTNGSVQSTGKNTDLCLSSTNALFIMKDSTGTYYTRNGAFEFDADGNYVQPGNGMFVQGWMATDGAVDTGAAVTNIQIPSGKSMAPVETTLVAYSNNLNSDVPTITSMTNTASGTITTGSLTATAADPVTVTLSDGTKLTYTSGKYTVGYSTPVVTTFTAYDSLGASHDVTLYFTLTDKANDKWVVQVNTDGSGSATITEDDGTTTTVTMADQDLQFDTDGKYVSGSGSVNLALTNGSGPTQDITVTLGDLTQYASSSTIAGKPNGNAAGTLSSLTIDSLGQITGNYTNGVKQVEAQVALQRFTNPSGLDKVGSSLYQDSNNAGLSGSPNTAKALGATITPAALEMSNVDIANEFTDMIVTQRGFQSNSKIITVSDEMLETLINLKR
ncbi:MAG: flagellar hook protein FlgE [Schwartzia sp.]|nr:flagellar hook protein FlgE [Schwartzia sp. (in: firmicutes)]